MCKAMTWFSREYRELSQYASQMERRLESADHQADASVATIREAAAQRATIAAKAIRELKKLLPTALSQAKKGKPALLRMILRATK
jgi:hypothetical protein